MVYSRFFCDVKCVHSDTMIEEILADKVKFFLFVDNRGTLGLRTYFFICPDWSK